MTEQTRSGKSPRVLACVLCQQSKIKCDRQFPCAHCVRVGVQCVQATRQRRHRFHERELLGRIRQYEGLLRQHNIQFDLFQAPAAEHGSPVEDGARSRAALPDADGPLPKEETAIKSKSVCVLSLDIPKDHALISRRWTHLYYVAEISGVQ